MVGCRHGAKNTLVKNYLWFAEKLGVKVFPERQVTEIRPLGAADGSDGYAVTAERSGSWFHRGRQTLTAKAASWSPPAPSAPTSCCANCKHSGALPRLSDQIGAVVRTNSESIQAVTAPDDERDFSRSVAITSSIYPDPDTHIEVVTYGQAGDAMNGTFTADGRRRDESDPAAEVAGGDRCATRCRLCAACPFKWSQRTVILLVMQTRRRGDAPAAEAKLFGRGVRLQTEQDPLRPNPTFIPAAEQAARGSPSAPAASPRAP